MEETWFKYCFNVSDSLGNIILKQTRLVEGFDLFDAVNNIYEKLIKEFKGLLIDIIYIRFI